MAITDENRDTELGRFFSALRDRPLEPTDPQYVFGLHTDSSGDPIAELARQILWSEGGGTYLFTGQRGTGKSTELRRLRRDLERRDCVVFLLDMSAYLNETEPVEIGDFVISLMLALTDAVKGDSRFQDDLATRGFWEEVRDLLKTEVEIKEFSAYAIRFSLKSDKTFKEKLQAKSRGHIASLVGKARDLVRDVVDLVKTKCGADKRTVIIADSVERLRGVNAEGAKKVFDSAVALFSGNPENLKFPGAHVVYSVPPYLSALTANLSALYNSQMIFLASVHVFEAPMAGVHRRPSERGLTQMRRLVDLRFQEWRAIFAQASIDQLARSTGGDIRDFFRLIQACLVKGASPGVSLPIGDSVLTDVVNTMRREMLPIADDDKDWLKEIATSHQAELKSLDKLSTLGRYFDTRLVLDYRNGHDWYDVNPLLWEIVDSHVSPSKPGSA